MTELSTVINGLEPVRQGHAVLHRGMSGPAVRKLQELLNAAGIRPPLNVDGNFGPTTEEAVKYFQRKHHLKDDGVVGQATLTVLSPAKSLVLPQALKLVKTAEGGRANYDADMGGLTQFGITQGTWDKWCHEHHLPHSPVDKITPATSRRILKEWYWDRAGCALLPQHLAIAQMDMAVNSGPERAIRFFQKVLGVKVTGVIDGATLKKLSTANQNTLVRDYLNRREKFFERTATLGENQVFLPGWRERLDNLRKTLGVTRTGGKLKEIG